MLSILDSKTEDLALDKAKAVCNSFIKPSLIQEKWYFVCLYGLDRIRKAGSNPIGLMDKQKSTPDGIDKLLDMASYLFWDPEDSTRDDEYLNTILPRLKAGEYKSDYQQEEIECMAQIRSELPPEDWSQLENIVAERIQKRRTEQRALNHTQKVSSHLKRIESRLQEYQFRLANDQFYKCAEALIDIIEESQLDDFEEEYHRLREQYEAEFINANEEDFRQALLEQDLDEMGSVLLALEELGDSHAFYAQFLRRHESRIRNMQLQYETVTFLMNYDFQEADSLIKEYPQVFQSVAEYEGLKATLVERYFEGQIDKEQALALSKIEHNLLVKARAGSGKTRTILYKTKLLLEKYGIKPSEILILAFNNDAANQIRDKLQNLEAFGFSEFENAMTFHGFAKRQSKPEDNGEDILGGDGNEEIKRHELLKYILKQKVWNENFQENLYCYFRKELEEIKRYGVDLRENERLLHRRNLRQITLKGEHVKSDCEKFIADFLLEHDIAYGYEYRIRETIPDKYDLGRSIKPDFTLCLNKNDPGRVDGKGLIIEHWAIDEKDSPIDPDKPLRRNGKAWSKSWREYQELMDKKRTYFEDTGKLWIETSPADLVDCDCHATRREHFESCLKNKLQAKGIRCEKLPETEVVKRIGERHEIRILKMFDQFLKQAKKYEMTSDDIASKLAALEPDEKTETFIRLALAFLKEYDAEMKRRKLIDFDDCIIRARECIKKTNGEALYEYYGNRFKIKDLKWIIIDEYQDFSNLFYTLIDTIRQVNPNVSLFCVGDDWQAINGFAGSSLEFYQRFADKLPPAEVTHVANNYRSDKCIVDLGNSLMKEQGGEPARNVHDLPDTFVDNPTDVGKIFVDSKAEARFCEEDDHKNDFLKQKYLKKLHGIVLDNPGKEILLLSRENKLFSHRYSDLEAFRIRFKECFTEDELDLIGDFDRWVKISSAHKAKGLEADIVVILKCCAGKFPLIHPDAVLDEVFGRTLKHVLDEERRLFYVAITRAKERLYILYDGEEPSQYLEELGLVRSKPVLTSDFLQHLWGKIDMDRIK